VANYIPRVGHPAKEGLRPNNTVPKTMITNPE